MSFKDINTALTERAYDLCTTLLKNGKRQGNDYVCGSVSGEAGKSLHVTLEGPKAGRWMDFAANEGGDLLNLIEQALGLSPKQAADWARSFLGLPAWAPDTTTPPPFDPLRMGFKRPEETEWRHGTVAWTYRDATGAPQAWVVRFDEPDGSKNLMPIRIIEGKHRWKGYTGTEKRPLYNLDKLTTRPDAPVMVVEGEKTADAASKLFPAYVCLTWMGGTANVQKADWMPLMNRSTPVVLWADADEPGRKAMAYIAQLIPGSKRINTSELPAKWDVADPVPEGISLQGMLDRALATDPEADKRAKEAAAKEEKESGIAKYHLPHRCELSKVESDLLKYKVFEHAGQVYAMRGNAAMEVSNCTVQIHQHIITKDGALALVTLSNQVEHERVTMDVPFDMFSTSLGFIKLLGNRGNFQWWGTDGDFTGYKRMLMDRMGKGRIITELGGQPEGFFVFSNAMVNGSITMLDTHGCFEAAGHRYYVPAGNTFYQGDPAEFSVQKRMALATNSSTTFAAWNAQMVQVFGEQAYAPTVFAVASAFSGHIFQLIDGFPLLFLYGPGGSGKDQCIKFSQGLYGKPQPEIFLSGPNTDKGLIKMFAEFTDVPMNLAEYRNGLKKDMDELLKSMWGRIGYRLAAMRGKRTETIPINCPAYISGNDYPNRDNALMRRLVVVEFPKVKHDDAGVAAFNTLRTMAQEGYSNVLAEVLKHRPDFVQSWYRDHYKPARTVLLEAFGSTEVDSSIMANLQVLLGTFTFFRDKLTWAFTADQFTAHLVAGMRLQLAKRSEGSEVSNFFTCFVHAARQNQLREGQQFKVVGDELLFYFTDVFGAYAKAHQEVFGERGEKPGDMRAKLERHPCYIEQTKSTRIGPAKNSSALRIDMSKSGTNLKRLLTGGQDKFTEDDADDIFTVQEQHYEQMKAL